MPNAQTDDIATLHALNVGVDRRPLKRSAPGRTCLAPGCDTRLSVYNPKWLCWQHEPVHTYRPKVGRRRNSDRLEAAIIEAGPLIPPPMPSPDPDPVPEPEPPPTPIPTALGAS